jgi:hypothetical protein
MTIGRWPEWNTVAARERAKELRRDIDEGIDPLSLRETSREAPRVSDMITRYLAEHTPHLAPRNAADQHTIMHKLVAPDWGKKLVTEITKYDVEKLLNKIAAGHARPSKAKPNNRARKLQGPKPTPVRANRVPLPRPETLARSAIRGQNRSQRVFARTSHHAGPS